MGGEVYGHGWDAGLLAPQTFVFACRPSELLKPWKPLCLKIKKNQAVLMVASFLGKKAVTAWNKSLTSIRAYMIFGEADRCQR